MFYRFRVVNHIDTSKYYPYREEFLRRYTELMQPKEFRFMLRDLLTQRGLSGVGFARLVGCSKTWPSNIMNGQHKGPANKETLERWADALKLNEKERWRFIGLAGLDHAPKWFQEWYWSSKKHL